MSTQQHAPAHPHERPRHPVMTVDAWAEDVAIGVMLFSAVAVLVVILALLSFL